MTISGQVADQKPTESHAGPSKAPHTSVPIPRSGSLPRSQPPMGPMSKSIDMPQRPKPGRKPLQTDDPTDRRRTQNRQAQRNFRDKRNQRQYELECELQKNRLEFERKEGEFIRQISDLQQEVMALQAQVSQLSAQAQGNNKGHLGRLVVPPSFQGPDNQITPPDEQQSPFGSTERDFTNFFPRSQLQSTPGFRQHHDSSAEALDFGECNFCTDNQNCVCKQTEPVHQAQFGNCDACQNDPARAQRCREIGMASEMGTGAPASGVACSAFIDQAVDAGNKQPATLFQHRPQVYPAPNGGFLLEEREAAEALQTLSKQPGRDTKN